MWHTRIDKSKSLSDAPDPVEHEIDDLLADRVVATSVVVGSIFLASDELLRVEELAVRASAHLI